MMMVSHGWRALALAALFLTHAACDGGGGTDPEPRVATAMAAATPTSQATATDNPVTEAPAVRVTDQDGQPMSGVAVTFSVAGGGTVANATATTNGSGTASAGTWTLGPTTGDNTVTASHGSLAPVHFSATGQPRVPTTITAVSATTQAAVTGTAVAAAPAVKVTDQTGRAMQGILVTFAVTAGGGTVAAAGAQTDAQGVASAGTWTLGAAGQNTVTATAGGAPPVAFNAMGQARVATTITTVSLTMQTAIGGTAVDQVPRVRVDDQTGAPLPGVTVAFAVTAGGGHVANPSATTDAAGIASAGSWTMGPGGQNTVTATVGSGTVHFNATAQPRIPSSLTIESPTEQAAYAGTAVAGAPAVRVYDQTATPLAGAIVTFAVTSGGGTVGRGAAASNADGLASAGSWTLGATPGQNTVTASINGMVVTFTATGQNPCDVAAPYEVGGTVSGAFSATDCAVGAGRRRDVYQFNMGPQPVVITATSPTVATSVAVYDLQDRLLASGGGTSPLRLFAGGATYLLHVETVAAVDNLGSYQLTSAPFAASTAGCKEFSIGPDMTVRAALEAADCDVPGSKADNYYVIVYPGETLTARMLSTALDAYLHLFDERGSRIAESDDGLDGTNAMLTYTNFLGIPVRWRLVAASTSASARGEYMLSVRRN